VVVGVVADVVVVVVVDGVVDGVVAGVDGVVSVGVVVGVIGTGDVAEGTCTSAVVCININTTVLCYHWTTTRH
jgi:hypothetical protein